MVYASKNRIKYILKRRLEYTVNGYHMPLQGYKYHTINFKANVDVLFLLVPLTFTDCLDEMREIHREVILKYSDYTEIRLNVCITIVIDDI